MLPIRMLMRCNHAQMKNSTRLVLHLIAKRHIFRVSAFHCMGIASSPLRAMPTPAPRNDARCEERIWRPPQADEGSPLHRLPSLRATGWLCADAAKQSPCNSVRAMRRRNHRCEWRTHLVSGVVYRLPSMFINRSCMGMLKK